MIRIFSLLALLVLLAACDTVAAPATAEVSVGSTYAASAISMSDANSGDLLFDYLANGASIAFDFVDDRSFAADIFIPEAALVASGETDDLDGDFAERVLGTYTQADGVITFEASDDPSEFSDTFFTDEGWTIANDGGSIRYEGVDGPATILVVLSRQ